MAEPAASAGAAVTTGVVSIAGVALGLQYDVLAAGLAGGLWSLTYRDSEPGWMGLAKRGGSAIVASLVAGYLTPLGAVLLTQIAPASTADLLRLPAAALIGLFAHRGGEWLLALAQKKVEGVTP